MVTSVTVKAIPLAVWRAYGRAGEFAISYSYPTLINEWAARIKAGLWEK